MALRAASPQGIGADVPAYPSSHGDRDIDAAFEDIVAHWSDGPAEPDRPRRPGDDGAPTRLASDSGAAPAEPTSPGDHADLDRVDSPDAGAVAAGGPTTDAPSAPAPTRRRPGAHRADDSSRTTSPGGDGGHRQASGITVPPRPDLGAQQEHFGFRGYTPAEEPEESYVPPAPAPMPAPQADPTFWTILGCLVGGPLVMLVLVLTDRTSMTLLMAAGVVATIVGFALLVMRGSRGERDPHDDGARL